MCSCTCTFVFVEAQHTSLLALYFLVGVEPWMPLFVRRYEPHHMCTASLASRTSGCGPSSDKVFSLKPSTHSFFMSIYARKSSFTASCMHTYGHGRIPLRSLSLQESPYNVKKKSLHKPYVVLLEMSYTQ